MCGGRVEWGADEMNADAKPNDLATRVLAEHREVEDVKRNWCAECKRDWSCDARQLAEEVVRLRAALDEEILGIYRLLGITTAIRKGGK